ncbi:transposon Tf2-6 polyprotein [Trichonephila clavipes]|nr:transposon Tf2-6 polyprotein [Trichonephila clavipes]
MYTKFNYTVPNLPPESAVIVRDLIITPDEMDPYGAIKAQMIQRTGDFAQRSERAYVGTFSSQQLPTSVQTILASITPITVEKAAEVNDRILEVSIPNVSLSTNAVASSSENRILQDIETEPKDRRSYNASKDSRTKK